MKAKIKKTATLLLALLFSYSFSEIFIPIHNKEIGYIIFVYSYLIVFSFFVIGYLIRKSINSMTNNQTFKKVLKLLLVVLISFFTLIVIIPQSFFDPMKYTSITLNPKSTTIQTNRNEVWLKRIIIDDNDINIQKINVSNGWIYKEGSIVSTGGNHNPQMLNLSFKKDVQLIFGKHEWSGKVEINNGVPHTINLNSKTPSEEIIRITKSNRLKSNLPKLIAYIISIALLSISLLIALSFFRRIVLSNRNK
ncbi:hypothetical protein [Paenibacillus sp. HW567]|uniref:hypothetical protein n=1 Tax=Paenibacillus sp. HW567 TaxID=1034769 RepID=UPI00036F88F4|nr:hypothetical protein [Paenibacillus sp. HW567]